MLIGMWCGMCYGCVVVIEYVCVLDWLLYEIVIVVVEIVNCVDFGVVFDEFDVKINVGMKVYVILGVVVVVWVGG